MAGDDSVRGTGGTVDPGPAQPAVPEDVTDWKPPGKYPVTDKDVDDD